MFELIQKRKRRAQNVTPTICEQSVRQDLSPGS